MNDEEDWRVRATEVAGRWQAVVSAISWGGRILFGLALIVPIRLFIGALEFIAGRETEIVIDVNLAFGITSGWAALTAMLALNNFRQHGKNKELAQQVEDLKRKLNEPDVEDERAAGEGSDGDTKDEQ